MSDDATVLNGRGPLAPSPALKRRFAWGLVALEFAPLIALLPVVVLVWWVMIAFGLWPAFIITCLTGPVFVTTSCLVILALRRFGLPSTPVGIHHLRSRLVTATPGRRVAGIERAATLRRTFTDPPQVFRRV